jgi:hypothetical protein
MTAVGGTRHLRTAHPTDGSIFDSGHSIADAGSGPAERLLLLTVTGSI